MLDAFGTLLDRPIIRRNSEPKYPLLIQMYEAELDSTKKMFDAQNSVLKVTKLNFKWSNFLSYKYCCDSYNQIHSVTCLDNARLIESQLQVHRKFI